MADPSDKFLLSTGTKLFADKDYELLSEGYAENYTDGNPSVTMRVRTRWPGSYEFVANCLGSVGCDLTRNSGVSRQTPIEFPDEDYQPTIVTQGDLNNAFLGWWCTSAKLIGTHGELTCQDQLNGALVPAIKDPRELVAFTDYDPTTGDLYDPGYNTDNKPILTGVGFAEYELTFEPLPYEVRTDAEMDTLDEPQASCELSRGIIRRVKFGGNNFTLQPGSLYWLDRLTANRNDPNARVDSEAVKPFPNATLTYTWVGAPSINWPIITSTIGKVNASETGTGAPSGKFDYRADWQGIVVPGGVIDGFLPGVLLFTGVTDITPRNTAIGQLVYDIQFEFLYRPDGHQKIYRAATDTFERVVRVANRTADPSTWKDLLDESVFSNLFKI